MEIKTEDEIILEGPSLLALRDVHSKSTARTAVIDLILSGKVKVLFIEWPHNARGIYKGKEISLNDLLMKCFREGITRDLSVELNDGSFFAGLASDASPTIIEITAFALSHGVQVFACDLDVDTTIDIIKKDPTLNGGLTVLESWAFQATGLKVRDEFAGKLIGDLLCEGPHPTGRLMLWGSNHFDKDQAENEIVPFKEGLGTIIENAYNSNKHLGSRPRLRVEIR